MMGITRKTTGTGAPATPAPRKPAAKAAEPETQDAAEAPAEEPAPAVDAIITPRQRARMQSEAAKGEVAEAAKSGAAEPGAGLDDWTLSGDEAAARAQAEIAKREEEKAERRARGYWPREFRLIPPGTPSKGGSINDRYQADIIVLDAKMGPAFNLHRMMNPRSNRLDVYEPCPKEWDSCPLCPPTGQYDSRFVALLTVLNITGYQIKTGERAGEWVPMSQELVVVEVGQQPFFHAVLQEHGTLRGLHLTMTRASKSDPDIGIPTFSNGQGPSATPVFHTEEAIEKFIRDNGMWQQKKTKDGEIIDEREDWLRHPFIYASFLNRPSGADLRARYQNGSQAPLGARSGGNDSGQWGNGRYDPGSSAPPQQGQWGGGGVPLDADLDDAPF